MPDSVKRRILNVDDDEAGRYAVTRALKKAGFLVIEAANGGEALQKVQEERPDLVLLDVNMPDISGLEVCRQIKRDPGTARIPVIHLSATPILPSERVQGLDGGADGYLVEPVDPDELVATIRSFIRNRDTMETTLRESAERLKFALEGSNDGIWDMQMDTGTMYISPRGAEILGYSPDELPGIAQTWSQLVHPDDASTTERALARYLEGSTSILDVEHRLKTKSGTWKWIRTRGKVVSRDEKAVPVRMVGTYADISECKFAEDKLRHITRLYVFLSQVNQAILRTHEPNKLFLIICQVAIEFGGFRMAWVGLTDESADRIRPVAHAGHENGYLDQILIGTGNSPMGNGPTGTAVREGGIVTSYDIATEPRMLPWRDEALKRGYRSSAAVPLRCKGKTIGALTLYSTEQDFFTVDEQRLLVEIGEDISFALDSMALEKERFRAEDELRESEDKFKTLFENAGDAIFIMDRNVFLDCNKKTLEIFHCTRDQIILHSPVEFSPERQPDGRLSTEKARENIDAALSGEHRFFEWVHLHADGTPFHTEVTLSRLILKGEYYLQAIVRDISERKVAEKSLRDAARNWQYTFDSAQDAICLLDADQRLVMCNRAMQEVLGVTGSDGLTGRHCWEVVHGTAEPIPGCPFFRMQQSLTRETMDLEIGDRHFTVVADPILDDTQKLIGAVHNIRDITEFRRNEKALLQTNKKLTLLSSITRHDILNQLLALNGFLGLLHRKVVDPNLEDYFSRIMKASARISTMIQFTREYEQIGIKAPAWQNSRILVDTAEKQAAAGHIQVQNDLPAGTELFADPLVIKVFYNLVDNAAKHGGKITTLRLYVTESGDNQLILCEDNGDGIPADEKEKIFERGFGKNTGMGLFLSREILAITDITIRETGEPGKGARFEIFVPKGAWRFAGKDM